MTHQIQNSQVNIADLDIVNTQKIVKPHPGGQTNFLSTDIFEVLFGGAAGPGKTFALVLDALGLQFKNSPLGKYAIEVPEYRAVLFRRQTTQLADIIDECKTYYFDFGAVYVGGRKGDPGVSFNFPKYYQKNGHTYKTYTEGARIFLCHMNDEKDKENHHGFEYQYVGFDELTQFLHSQYIYLFSRCRSTIKYLFPRIRATANPVGIGLGWVKRRFLPHIEESKVRYFISDLEDEKNVRGIEAKKDHPHALPRIYIPGKLRENLTLMELDPGYASRIKAMGAKMAKALLDSDWSAMEGQFFDLWNQGVHIIREKDYLTYTQIKHHEIIGVIDYGRIMVLSLLYKDSNGDVVLFDQMTSIGEVRGVRVERTKKFLKVRGMENILVLGDTDMWLKDAFDLANQEAPNAAFINAGIKLQKVSKISTEENRYRVACNVAIKNGLYYEVDANGNITKQPKFKTYERCKEFNETFPSLPIDEDNPEDIADVDDDHWYDSMKMGYMVITTPREREEEDTPQWLKEMVKAQKDKVEHDFMGV